ncbi:MAG: GAF domain-containing protein [Chloroflexi bacterium]|nr:GAF domain-containing protein [Chloroflexota bacterium]MBV9893686.1 GAF domain-containing protein [Chloroflexota bacterium]
MSSSGWGLVGSHDPVELCRLIYETVARQMDATMFFFGLYDAASRTIEVVWQVENGKELSGGSFPLGAGLSSQVVLSGQPMLIRDWSHEGPRIQVQYATDTPGLPESAVAAPLKLGEHTIGLISVQSYNPDAYDARDLSTLEALASEAAIVIAGLNYSEHLSAQVRRRVSELEGVLSSMADALLMIDPDGALVRLNRSARELLSLDESSIVLGQAFEESQWEQWPSSGRAVAQALRPVIERLHATHQPQEIEVELPGTVQHILSFRATPLYYADGVYNGGVIVFRDVTAERLVERFKDEMFSIASHDLKTPATVIKAQAQWLKRRFSAGAAARDDFEEGLTMIADQADRLSKLLNLLLDLSRIESGHLELDLAPVDLRAILMSMARALQSTTDSHLIEVDAPVGVIGHWDQRRIEEVVQNLLNNAVKYSPVGGRVDVRLTADSLSATVTVTDSGIGISADDAPHVFERFYRGGRADRRLEGTGLGLYICHAIVTAHGGKIWAESSGIGHGSTFAFCLPLKPPNS